MAVASGSSTPGASGTNAANTPNTQAARASGERPNDEQAAIAREAARLGLDETLPTAARTALAQAAQAAAEAARQVALGDRAAARVPAAAAEHALEQAAQAQEKEGRGEAAVELEELRRALNEASRVASPPDRVRKLAAIGAALRAAALEQQRSGSAAAARQFADLADLLGASPSDARASNAAGSAANSPERARDVALAAARVQVSQTSPGAALDRVTRRLQRIAQHGPAESRQSTASAPLNDLEMASQEAQWVTRDGPTLALARQLAMAADTGLRAAGGAVGVAKAIADAAAKLATALEAGRSSGARDEVVRRFRPTDVDPEYRAAVETYFERLSRGR